jgi:hypothetical protein
MIRPLSARAFPPFRPSSAAAAFFLGGASYSSSRWPVAISMTRTALETTSAGRF